MPESKSNLDDFGLGNGSAPNSEKPTTESIIRHAYTRIDR